MKPAAFILRAHRPGDMGWVVFQESAGYSEEYGWDSNFEATVLRVTADFLTDFDARRERCWIAEREQERLGHIFLVKDPERDDTAKLRLLFVDRNARGQGVGEALVTECIAFARSAGYSRVILWTHDVLTAAHRIYRRAGFQMIEEKPHNLFGEGLLGQTWELIL